MGVAARIFLVCVNRAIIDKMSGVRRCQIPIMLRDWKGADFMSEFIDDLLTQMTLQEKVALLAGADMWHTVPIERLGIPSLKMTDGPNGARGSGRSANSLTSACFPVGIALAATWNTELVERVGQALAQEALSKGARVLLAPTVNIHRSPLNGRNFECFSEDPYLSARMAVAYISGVQSQGVGATVKHFVCNDSEFERHTISSEVRERPLREIYLVPFQAAVQKAGVWAVMASYNKVNGVYASENAETLTRILRDEWGFDGLIMSDWYGTKSTAAAVNAGLDLEMPGPALWRGENLLQAVKDGEVNEITIDARTRRVLQLIDRAGLFAQPETLPEQAIDRPEDRALTREAAGEGIVLLKNERNVLPLRRETLRSLAIIGPNAKTARIMGGGSSTVNPHYAVTPFDGISASVGEGIHIGYEPGCANHKLLPLPDASLLSPDSDGTERGLILEFFNNDDLSGAPVLMTRTRATGLYWLGQVPEGVDARQFSVRCHGWFTPRETGTYTFGLVSVGLSRFFVDGQEVIDNWTQQTAGEAYYGVGTIEVKADINLEAGRAYEVAVVLSKNAMVPLVAMHLGCFMRLPADALERAARLAAVSDVALVCVGLSNEWESEGFDRPDLELVGEQAALIERVAAANKNTVVILNTGSPITIPWLDRVAAVVQAWYPGQECGNAIADVLFGDVTPSGKLPQTFPVRLQDNPAYINYPGENGRVYYGEGLFVGYRYYEKKDIAPLFPFGFGLSYTTFSYSNLRLSSTQIGPDDTLHLSVDVTNTGQRTGKEVVQVYIRDVSSSLRRPEKELKAFTKVQIAPGETRTVTLTINRDALAYYDDLAQQWVAEAGEFTALIGSSSQNIRTTATFVLTKTSSWR
jgi:beta-glucosidase